MKDNRTVPIVVGVTGHRAIRPEDRDALGAAVTAQLKKLRQACPASELVLLTSLAEGGDLLCADAAEALDIGVIAALPMPPEVYRKDFSPQAEQRLDHHLSRAERVFVTPAAEAVPQGGPTRDFLFRQAGIYVSAHCHVMLALWDGGPGTAAACGTAEAVDFSLHGAYYPAAGMPMRSESNEAVIHIFTPRRDRTGEPAGTVHVLGNADAVREALRRTDEFNRLAAALPAAKRRLLPEDAPDDGVLSAMEGVYLSASALSTAAAARYRRVLALLAVASTLLTAFFLLYDEARAVWMILLCGAMLLLAWGCQRYARRVDCHRQYIEYRALAECLRVSAFLRYAGSTVSAADQLSWTQQEETAWIMDALCALDLGPAPTGQRDIRLCWVEDQRQYHQKAGKKSLRASRRSDAVVRWALRVSVTLYLAAVVFELLCGGELLSPTLAVGDPEGYRTALKLVLGCISAATLFTANYYGRLSLSRTLSDHTKMERFYAKMSAQLLRHGQTEGLMTVLAREELSENGNWCSYQRDNTPDLSV